jgi:hypothetical protein
VRVCEQNESDAWEASGAAGTACVGLGDCAGVLPAGACRLFLICVPLNCARLWHASYITPNWFPLMRAGGAASLASLASAEWQQQQQHYIAVASSRPPVPWLKGRQYMLPTHQTAPPHLISAAAAAATAELSTGVVWRASSWQGPDADTG